MTNEIPNKQPEPILEKKPETIDNLIPKQENRDGLLVNVIENKRLKGEILPEQLGDFTKIVHSRIAEEMAQEKTTLPKDRLQGLDEELERNPQIVKAIIESFGLGVASDSFMLYGLIRKTKDLIRITLNFYNETKPRVSPGDAKPISERTDDDILRALKQFWPDDVDGPNKTEFPHGDDINYYSGKDTLIDDEHPRFMLERGHAVPGYRYIFGPTRKNKTDYAESMGLFGGAGILTPKPTERGPIAEDDVKRVVDGELKLHNFSLRFRDNSDMVGQKWYELVMGYPAEWYIAGSVKSKILSDYFKKYVIPEIRKNSTKVGI